MYGVQSVIDRMRGPTPVLDVVRNRSQLSLKGSNMISQPVLLFTCRIKYSFERVSELTRSNDIVMLREDEGGEVELIDVCFSGRRGEHVECASSRRRQFDTHRDDLVFIGDP